METKIILVTSPADLEAAQAFQSTFEAGNVPMEVIALTSDGASPVNPGECETCLLWLTPRTGMEVYEISKKRKENGLSTLNILPERIAFTAEQRDCVGRNAAMMLALQRGDVVEAVMKRLERKVGGTNATTTVQPQPSDAAPVPYTDSQSTNDSVEGVPQQGNPTENMPEAETENPENDGVSPTISLIFGIVVVGIGWGLTNWWDLRVDNIITYILYIAGVIVNYAIIQCLGQWRKLNGKTVYSWIVLIILWYIEICWIWAIFYDLYRWISE